MDALCTRINKTFFLTLILILPATTVAEDFEQLLERALETENRLTQYKVAKRYIEGDGVEKDLSRAVSWLSDSAEQSYAPAQYQLGMYYFEGRGGLVSNPKEAARLFTGAANQGHKESLFMLGQMYEEGIGVEQDDETSSQMYLKAAHAGHIEAQYQIGNRYEDGIGIDEDRKSAFKWFRSAAEQGHRRARIKVYGGGR